MARQASAAPGNAPSAIRSRVPVYRSAAPSSMQADAANRVGFKDETGRSGLKLLEMRRGNTCAIAPPHQHEVMGLAQIRDDQGEQYSDRRKRDCEREGRNVLQHAMTKIV